MNLEYFIAKKIIKGNNKSKRLTKPIIRISILAISLGIIVMILALSIVAGFKKEIRNKVIGFGSHIQITKHDSHNTYEASPIDKNLPFYSTLTNINGIKHIQVFANKAGIIKTKEEIYGVVVKGIGSDFDWSFFKDKIIDGNPFVVNDSNTNNKIVISELIANKTKLKVGDKLFLYFIQNNGTLRPKDFIISGIYKSGLEQYDKLFVLTDIAHIQKRNNWTNNQVGGFEVIVDNYDQLNILNDKVYSEIGYDLNSVTIVDQNPDIFNWLELQDMNVVIIIILMIIVATINIISALLILILERTNTIGILKALGMKNWNVRKIFIYNAIYLILKGLFWGNVIGLTLCYIQLYFGVLKLPEESYYISEVPISINYLSILFVNIGTLIICFSMLILPSYIITKISPIKAIRFN